MNSGYFPSCARRVAGIAEALCRAVGIAVGRGSIQAAMALLVCRRIQRVRAVLLALEARLLAGDLAAPRLPGRGIADEKGERPVARAGRGGVAALPRRLGWLCAWVPGEAACFAGQLRVVLAEPGMVALLAACPQAIRTVGPLCRMLGIDKADYRPGRPAPAPAPAPAIGTFACTGLSRPGDAAGQAEPAVVASIEPQPGAVMAGMGWVRFIPG